MRAAGAVARVLAITVFAATGASVFGIACGDVLEPGAAEPDAALDAVDGPADAGGDAPGPDADADADAGPSPPVTQVSAGVLHACALRAGQVYCWGGNARGAVGAPPADDVTCPLPRGNVRCRPSPVRVRGALATDEVAEVSAGGEASCARTRSGAVYCWGSNDSLRLGVPEAQVATFSHAPQRVDLPSADGVGLATHNGCARVRDDGGATARCWGSDAWGQLGRGAPASPARPAELPTPVLWDGGIDGVTLPASVDASFACLRSGKRIACWGRNLYGALGHVGGADGDKPCTYAPSEWCNDTPVALAGDFDDLLFSGFFASCGRRDGGTLCWGTDTFGMLGRGAVDLDPHPSPEPATAVPADLVAISGRVAHACGVTKDGDVWCWGSSSWGESSVGDAGVPCGGAFVCQPKPVKVPGLPPIAEVSTGFFYTVALARDGSVWAWGRNSHGQLGHPPFSEGDVSCPNAYEYEGTSLEGTRACNPTPRRLVLPP